MKRVLKKLGFSLALVLLIVMGSNKTSFAHCEIPCGIYADSVRIVLLTEHIATVEKSMKMIVELSSADPINYNQLVRWINNKEDHAKKIQEIATQYFMFQRVNLSDDPEIQKKNQELLKLLHEICVFAMKAKQTTDLQFVEKLNNAVHEFSHLYFDSTEHKHQH